MPALINILAFLIIFSVIILIHEFGHYYFARKAGIKVEEFGIGLPPRIFGYKRKGMIWSINLIPFGGFVRMLGEDSSDPKALNSKSSFVNKTVGQRLKVVTGGVIMNFALAFVLLTGGFIVGIQPLIVDGNDFLNNLKAENIVLEHGIRIKEIAAGSIAERAGLQKNDVLKQWDGLEKNDPEFWADLFKNPATGSHQLLLERNSIKILLKISEEGQWGADIYGATVLPAVAVLDVKPFSGADRAGLTQGDVILSINGEKIFSTDDYNNAILNSGDEATYQVLREGILKEFKVSFNKNKGKVIITEVISGSAAEKAGFYKGDIISKINLKIIGKAEEVIYYVKNNADKDLVFNIIRNGRGQDLKVKVPWSGQIGIYMQPIQSYDFSQLTVYNSSVIVSIAKIKDVKYPFYLAPLKVFGEIKRLSVVTVVMFGNVIKTIFGTGSVPEGVTGPVGIARATGIFVKEGLASLVRFTALLSLSLGVINILPLPALDGGRLAFIMLEAARGRKVNQRWESRIHMIGFFLLMAMLLMVTYNDIAQWIRGG